MSRSLGDLVAASVGVSPEPEVLSFDLKTQDKFIIIASDGVWEFLSNDDVMQLTVPYFLRNQPEKACNRLIKESVLNWKKVYQFSFIITIFRKTKLLMTLLVFVFSLISKNKKKMNDQSR